MHHRHTCVVLLYSKCASISGVMPGLKIDHISASGRDCATSIRACVCVCGGGHVILSIPSSSIIAYKTKSMASRCNKYINVSQQRKKTFVILCSVILHVSSPEPPHMKWDT